MSKLPEWRFKTHSVVDAINNSLIVGKIVNENPRRSGYMGDFKSVPVLIDPNCPPGMVYWVPNYPEKPILIDTRSRWQHFIDWLKGMFKR